MGEWWSRYCAAAVASLAIGLWLALAPAAPAAWSPPLTVAADGAQYSFGQDVGPHGGALVVWSGPGAGGGYSVFARRLDADGGLGPKLTLSEAPVGAVLASAYAPAVRFDAAGIATVVWMESAYGSESCFNDEGEPESGDGGECEVDEYVWARQVGEGDSLSAAHPLQHRHTVYPEDGSFGGSSPAYVTYGQPALAGGPADTLTVAWPEGSFGSGCAAYGYSSSYADAECEAQESVRWVRLDAAAAALGSPQVAYANETSGYGSGQPLLSLRAGAAADGTTTILFSARTTAAEEGCWGGESTVAFLRISAAGAATAPSELDSGCGSVRPDLALDAGGTATAVWGWSGAYSGDEALFARIAAGGAAEAPQTLLASAEGAHVSGLDVARGAGAGALAVWSEEGRIRSRRIPASGSPGPTATVAAPAPDRVLIAPRLAVGSDDSAAVLWEAGASAYARERSLQAVDLAPDGTPGQRRTLMAANRWNHGVRVAAGPAGSFLATWRLSVPRQNRLQSAWLGAGPSQENDDFEAAEPLGEELPAFAAGSTAGAGRQTGEPAHAGLAAGASVWYSWTATETGPVGISTCADEGFDPALAVYTGSALEGLSEVAAARDGAASPCGAGDAGIRFEAEAGVTYRIAVDGEGGSEGSFALKLIARDRAPANDAFAAAREIGGTLPRQLSGTNEQASREPGEPEHAGQPGGASVWYSWTATRSAPARISLCGYDLEEPLLGVYTGAELGDLEAVDAQAGPPVGCAKGTSVGFAAEAGTTYRVAVDGRSGREGRFGLGFAQQPANDDLESAQEISYLPAYLSGATSAAGKETDEPEHAGDPGGASVWYSWTPTSSGTAFASACLYTGKGASALLGVYTGADVGHLSEVGADAGSGSGSGCASGYSEVSFSFQAGSRYLIAVDGEGGAEASFALTLEAGPANDDFAAAQPLTGGLPQSVYGTSRHAGREQGEPEHAGQPGGASVWYSWTPGESGIAVISACGQFGGEAPLLGAYTGGSLAGLSEVAADAGGGEGCSGAASEVEFEAVAGETYHLAVDDPDGAGIWSFHLEVDLELTPGNDRFDQAEAIPAGVRWADGSNRHASREPGEPEHAGQPGGASVWFSWTPDADGLYAIATCSYGALDPLLAVYTGSSFGSLEQVAAADDEGSGCSDGDAEVRFEAVAGTAYRIAVDGKAGSAGPFELRLADRPDNDDLAAAATLWSAGASYVSGTNWLAGREDGEPEHGGEAGGSSVWYSWTPEAAVRTELAVCSYGALDPLLAVYTGSAPAALAPVPGEDAGESPDCYGSSTRLRFEAQAGTTYRIAVDGRAQSYGEFGLQLLLRPANDDLSDAEELGPDLPLSVYGDNRLAGAETDEPEHGGEAGGSSVWYSWTAGRSGTVVSSTCSYGTLDPLLAVYTGSSFGSLEQVAAVDDEPDAECSEGDAELRFEAVAGTTYRIAVDGKAGSAGQFQLRLREAGPANDDFADAVDVSQAPGLYPGTTAGAGAEPGEPGAPHQSVWYRLQADHSGLVRLHTCSAAGAPMDIDVFTGPSLTSLQQVGFDPAGSSLACDLAPGAPLYADSPSAAFQAVAGTVYWISVDLYQQISPSFELRPPGPFTLVVGAPANDQRAAAERIPYGGASLARTNAGATHEPAEPEHAGDPGGGSVWFRWFAAATGPVRIDTCGSEVDTLLSVFAAVGGGGGGGEYSDTPPTASGGAGEEYSDVPPPPAPGGAIAASDDSELCGVGSVQSGVVLEAQEGVEYVIAIDGKGGGSGAVQLTVDFDSPDTTAPETHAYLPTAINSHTLFLPVTRDEPESGFQCAVDGAAYAPCAISAYGAYVTVEIPGLADGPHAVALREVDAAGNADPTPLEGEVLVDTVAPQTEIAAGPEGLTKELGPFELAADEPTAYFECAIDGGPASDCDPTYYAPWDLADGPHTLKVVAVDRAFNRDPSPATRSFELDRTAPSASIDAGPEGTVEASGVTFELSADEPAGFRCHLDGGPFQDCESPVSFAGLTDAEHRFSVVPTDLAGNVGEAAERIFRVEARPPDTTIWSGPTSPLASRAAAFRFSGDEDLSGFECSLDAASFSACEDGYKVGELAEGLHTLEVRAVDLAGKRDPTPAEHRWIVDTTPPQTTIDSGPSGLTRFRGTFEFSADEDVLRFECAIDGDSEYVPCSNGYSIPPVPDGEHTLAVRAVDLAGNLDPTAAERGLTLDTTPPEVELTRAPPALAQSSVTIEFEVGEAGATTDCQLDRHYRVACASPFQFENLPDGPHTVSVIATDPAGNEGVAESEEFTVDEQPPETWITAAPAAYTSESSPSVSFRGSEDASEFRCSLDSEPFAVCESPLQLDELGDGEHTFRVFAVDTVGNSDPTPDSVSFAVDTVPPDTTITSAPSAPVHALAVPFSFQSSEALGEFRCAMDGGSFRSCSGIEHDGRVGEHVFEVRAFDRAGNADPTPASRSFTVVNAAPQGTLSLDRVEGPAPLDVSAAIGGSDGDGDGLGYEVQFGDGPGTSGQLPHGDLSHTYEEPGVYVVRLAVDDGFEPTVTTATVTVGPPEPLAADAGDDRTVVTGEPVSFDAGNSRPLRGVDAYEWSFGDGAETAGATPFHTYSEPGTYEAELTARRGAEEDSDTARVTVVPPPPGEVRVVVRGEGAPLAGAKVIVMPADGSMVEAVTDAGGVARLRGLADGAYKFYADKQGFVPGSGDLTVLDGSGTGQTELTQGEAASATVESKPMTLDEIEAAGIDPNDPDNQHVYQFEVHLNLKPPGQPTVSRTVGGMINRAGFLGPGCVLTSTTDCLVGIGGGGGGYASIHTTWVDGVDAPMLSALVIPFRATFLKEFYDVGMVVSNLAPAGLDLRHGRAAIELPSGMSLAPTAAAQSLDLAVPDVPGGESAQVHWVLRGDTEGEYDLTAHYGATLEPFGRSVSIDAHTAEPVKVWGGSALKLEVDVDEEVRDTFPYTVFVKLKNVADVPVYNPAVELLKEGRVGYIEQPRQQRSYAIRELLPGHTHVAGPFVIVPEPSGEIDLSKSFIRKTAGDVDLDGTIVTHERSRPFEDTPEVEVRGYGDKLVLDWEPVAGAGGYEVFSTPDRETDFPEDQLGVDFLDPTRAVVRGIDPDQPAFYGISSLLEPREMVHPLTFGKGDTNNEWPKLSIDSGERCGQRDDSVELGFEAVDFDLASYEMTLNGLPFGDPRPLSGLHAEDEVNVPFSVSGEDTDFEVVLRDVEGDERRASVNLACDYVALGDSYSSGEGVPTDGTSVDGGDFEGDLDHDGLENSDTNGCHRSRAAYAHLVMANADPALVGDRLKFHACSGAVLADMWNDGKESRQLRWVDPGAQLVTLSIGGNDMHFADIIKACVSNQLTLDPTCRNDHKSDFEEGYRRVEKELPKLLREIRQRAPRARILVVSYPQIFPSFPYDALDLFSGGLAFSCNTFLLDNINPWDIVWLSGMQKEAMEMVREAVESSGSRAEYVSMGDRFSGHDVCQEFDPWFNGSFLPPHVVYSFHPNAQGQQAMADAVLAQLGQPRPESFFQIQSGEVVDRAINVVAGGGGRAAKAVFSEYWPGSDVELTLESPSGRVIDRDTEAEDVEHELGPTYETYVVAHPEEGEWKMRFKGLDVAPGGEQVSYEAATAPEENVAPIAQFNQSLDGARPGQAVDFDASGSSDVDGEIAGYEWNFGDGGGAGGETVQHSFAAPGRYEVRLLVRDAGGAVGVFAQRRIWVRSDPVAADDRYETGLGAQLDVGAGAGLLANDAVDRSGGEPRIELLGAAAHGTFELSPGGGFLYRPDAGFAGTEALSYRLTDAGGFASAPATVRIEVGAAAGPGGPGEEPGEDPGGSDPGSGAPPSSPAVPGSPASPAASVTPAPGAGGRPKKATRCRKGFRKKRVRGKSVCVKKHGKHRPKKHRPKRR